MPSEEASRCQLEKPAGVERGTWLTAQPPVQQEFWGPSDFMFGLIGQINYVPYSKIQLLVGYQWKEPIGSGGEIAIASNFEYEHAK